MDVDTYTSKHDVDVHVLVRLSYSSCILEIFTLEILGTNEDKKKTPIIFLFKNVFIM